MRALLAELGDPQLAYPAIHVVGTNGKSTATRTIAALLRAEGLRGGARETAEAYLGRPVDRDVEVSLPGRFEWRSERELWDGAHNPDGIRWLVERLPARRWIVVASILADKDVRAIVRGLTPAMTV